MSSPVQFGLILPNRGILFGIETMQELLDMGVRAEESGLFQSLWVGDSILAKRRPESVALLAALAARTRRIRLAVGCMATFPVRHPVLLASQWATVDLIAGPNRLILAACLGGERAGGDWRMENDAFGVPQVQRVGRLEEGIEALRALWTQTPATYQGKYYQFADVILEPKPVTRPTPPIWLAANPRPTPGADVQANTDRVARRIARLADGWMTTWLTPEDFTARWQIIQDTLRTAGRDPTTFENSLYFNVNVNEDREAAFAESKRFLDTYYGFDLTRERLGVWVAYGSPAEIIEKIQQYVDVGVKEIAIRLASWDQSGQYRRLVEEILPAFTKARTV